MRWIPETPEQERERRGQWRLVFAWFPVVMRDGVRVWLEHYWVRQVPASGRVFCEYGIRFETERRAVGSPEEWTPPPVGPTGPPPPKPKR